MQALLGDEIDAFPDVETALTDPDGLLALGGDLSPNRLLHAYRNGIFPWFATGDPIMWWSPAERCVIYPDSYTPGRSLRKLLRRHPFRLTFNQAFDQVIAACAEPTAQRPDTWITDEMIAAYTDLHQMGHAHSLEVWQNGVLVGGLYGLQLNAAFCGESMFSRVNDASKVAFLHLIQCCVECGIKLVDCQLENPHLNRLGATLVTRADFVAQLSQCLALNAAKLDSRISNECKQTDQAWPDRTV